MFADDNIVTMLDRLLCRHGTVPPSDLHAKNATKRHEKTFQSVQTRKSNA